MMSGGFTDWAALPMEAAEGAFASVTKCLGCAQGDRDCLMAKSADDVMKCGAGQWYGPVVDGVFLPKSPLKAVEVGDDAVDYAVPIIIGSALEDKLMDIGRNADVTKLRNVVAAQLGHGGSDGDQGSVVDEALRLYPLAFYADHPEIYPTGWSPAYWAAREMFADRDFTCIMRKVAAQWSLKGKAHAFWYSWAQPQIFSTRETSVMKTKSDLNDAKPLGGSCYPCPGAGHGADIAFLFKNDEKVKVDTRSRIFLSVELQSFYVDFAWSAHPHHASLEGRTNLEELPLWHQYHEGNAMEFLEGLTHEVKSYRAEQCDFWSAHPSR